jgi:hypothetical protein
MPRYIITGFVYIYDQCSNKFCFFAQRIARETRIDEVLPILSVIYCSTSFPSVENEVSRPAVFVCHFSLSRVVPLPTLLKRLPMVNDYAFI